MVNRARTAGPPTARLGSESLMVNSVDKALRVLGAFDGTRRHLNLSQIAEAAGLDFSAAQRFMNDTVVNALGMRAFFLTLKIEKCASRRELAALIEDYTKAITKGAGAEEAAVLSERVRELLS